MHSCKGNACVVVNGHEQCLPSRTIDRIAPIACDAVAGPNDAPELLGIDVQHVSRRIVLIANHGLGRLQIAESRQARTGQYPAHGGRRDACVAGNARLQHAAFA